MNLSIAQILSQKIVRELEPYCSKIEVAGSIRRRKSWVNDIDIVLIPSNQGQLLVALQGLGRIKSGAGKLIRLEMANEISIDIYVATLDTWATLLLIRTGSKEHNIKLCSLARQKGMILHADGRGLVHPGAAAIYGSPAMGEDEPVNCDTEEAIFEALGLPYKKPEERN